MMISTIRRQQDQQIFETKNMRKGLRRGVLKDFIFEIFFPVAVMIGGFMSVYNFVLWTSALLMKCLGLPFFQGDLEFGFFFLWVILLLPLFQKEIRSTFKKIWKYFSKEFESIVNQ
ncbi:MAG: hypothetical protein KAQ63_00855 [Candidatus Moranbacteria bacterium]|nr:hypothetical protein [Candidatus Moranbacteria bacterium]